MASKSPRDHANAAFRQAVAAHQMGDATGAEAFCKLALTENEKHFDALHLMSLIVATRGEFGDALAFIDRALSVDARSAEAHTNRGRMLNELKRHEEALASYDHALALAPGNALILHNRGSTFLALNRFVQALADFDSVLMARPEFIPARHNRSIILNELGRHAEALTACDELLAVKRDFLPARYNRSVALNNLGRHQEAVAACDELLAIHPGNFDARHNRAIALMRLGRDEEAIAEFETVLQQNPSLGYVRGDLVSAKLRCCHWRGLEDDIRHVVDAVRAGHRASWPFQFLAISESSHDQLLCARAFVASKCPPSPDPIWRNERYRHSRIKLAYLSADLHDHATAHLTAGLFEQHDRSRFETIAVSFGPNTGDDMRARLENAFDQFLDVQHHSDREIAGLLRELEVDIAVDLKGFTLDSRPGIFALRPAPVQVNYLGYPGTMGARYIDYIIADPTTIPEGEDEFYEEKIVRLPDTYQPNWKRPITEQLPNRADCSLPSTGFVFACFNTSYKISPKFFDVWMRLLRAMDGSVLWLIDGTPAVVRNLRREAQLRGVAPDRLVFAPRCKPADHLARHQLADLFLDSLPYGAHTTASDALWAGAPVVTCVGTSFAGRVAASLLNAIGLPELATHSLEQYEALALKLAQDPELLGQVKDKLRRDRNTAPLFDTDRFRRHIEAAFERMYARYQRGDAPESFAAEPI
jgi:protein O-GlcNAc transferase